GARSGDVLLELDGVAVTRETWQKTGDSGDSVKILSLSDQEVIESSVSLENNPGVPLITSLFIVSLVFALSSFFVFYRANHTPQTLALSVLFVVMALAFAAAPAGARQLNWATDILQYALMGSAAMFFAFFSSFTLAPERVRKQNFVIRPLLVGMAVWTVAVGMLYVVSVYFLPEIFDAVRKVKLSQIGVGFLGGVIFLIIGYFGNSSPPEKEQLRIMAFGATATVIPFVLLSVAPDVVGLPAIINAETIVPTIVIIPLAFGYAILRHHLMGIRRLVHRGAAYTLMSFVAVVIYGGLIAVVRAAGGDELSNSTTLQILLLIILFVAIPLISGSRRLAFATVDRLLYRDFVDHANLSRRVSVEAANSQHFDDLARTVLRTMVTELQLMHAEFVRVWHNRSVVVASEGQAPDNFSQAVGAVLNGNKVPSAISVDSYKLDENGQTMIINLNQEPDGRLLMCLGPKITEEPFQPEDLELAQTVANHIATVIEKLELFDELQNKASELTELNRRLVDTQETERARIASYLHDDALAQISNMVWRYDEDDFPPGALDDLQAISTGLREISTSLHPGVLEELGLAPALEYLGNEAARLAGFHFKLHHGTITEDLTLDQETRLALYRIAQEALNNCQQHSRADNVWIHLALREDEIEMTVEDDGVGLPIEAPADKNVRLGLVGMRERATQARGQFKLLKNQPTGTTVLVCLPIHHNSEQTSP
ncbi:MAG: hypothetical protein QF368_00960, partial [SAR202 cluster bacterium]|nr:hypothetical protein [SAR202 cluster bacterium]